MLRACAGYVKAHHLAYVQVSSEGSQGKRQYAHDGRARRLWAKHKEQPSNDAYKPSIAALVVSPRSLGPLLEDVELPGVDVYTTVNDHNGASGEQLFACVPEQAEDCDAPAQSDFAVVPQWEDQHNDAAAMAMEPMQYGDTYDQDNTLANRAGREDINILGAVFICGSKCWAYTFTTTGHVNKTASLNVVERVVGSMYKDVLHLLCDRITEPYVVIDEPVSVLGFVFGQERYKCVFHGLHNGPPIDVPYSEPRKKRRSNAEHERRQRATTHQPLQVVDVGKIVEAAPELLHADAATLSQPHANVMALPLGCAVPVAPLDMCATEIESKRPMMTQYHPMSDRELTASLTPRFSLSDWTSTPVEPKFSFS